MKISDLFTRQHAETARELPIADISGKPTGKSFFVLGTESSAFITAKAKYMRDRLADPECDKERAYAELVSTLVVDWTFDEEFSTEAVIEAFMQAPYLASYVENYAYVDANKAEKAKKDSSTLQEDNSN